MDAHAAAGGDGRVDRPLRALGDALRPGIRVHLASGLYPGPFELPPGVELVGHGAVVLHAEGAGPVVHAQEARLEALDVQGGEVGLRAVGAVALARVRFSGQRRAAVRVAGGATLDAEQLRVHGVVDGADGVVLEAGARASVREARFEGPLRRAVDAADAEVTLSSVHARGPRELLHLQGGRAVLRHASAEGGRGPAVFAARGVLLVDGLRTLGHEYGLQTGAGSRLDARALDVRGPLLAAVAAVGSEVALRDSRLEGGSFAAAQLLESDALVERLEVAKAQATGVVVRLGRATLRGLDVHDVAPDADRSRGETDGDALHVRGAEVTLEGLKAARLAGAGLFASAAARVVVRGLSCEDCRYGAVVLELASSATLSDVRLVRARAPALSVLDRSRADVERLATDGDVPAVWADCAGGAEVRWSRPEPAAPPGAGPCVTVGPGPLSPARPSRGP